MLIFELDAVDGEHFGRQFISKRPRNPNTEMVNCKETRKNRARRILLLMDANKNNTNFAVFLFSNK